MGVTAFVIRLSQIFSFFSVLNKTERGYSTGLVETSSEATRSCFLSLVGSPTFLGPELSSKRAERNLRKQISQTMLHIIIPFSHFVLYFMTSPRSLTISNKKVCVWWFFFYFLLMLVLVIVFLLRGGKVGPVTRLITAFRRSMPLQQIISYAFNINQSCILFFYSY